MAEASDRAGTVRKLIELAMTHVATFAFPLVFAVICGRTLGIHDYGIVSFYAALAAFLGMVIEFGFDWYGIREVARHPAEPAAIHRILWNITAAKLLLCAGVVGVVMFFALSGYLITGLLDNELNRNGSIALGRFWARRIRRLLKPSGLFVLGDVIAPDTPASTASAVRIAG